MARPFDFGLSTPLDDLLCDYEIVEPQRETIRDNPILTAEELNVVRGKLDCGTIDDFDVAVLLDMIDALTDSYEQLGKRSAEEANRAQALVLKKEEEIAAHDDLHRQAANRIEQLIRDLALANEAIDASRDVLRRALAALREPMTMTDCRRAREILQGYHTECARAAAKARREPPLVNAGS